jgi:hypothetical protein
MSETNRTPVRAKYARDNSDVLTGRITTRNAVREDIDTLVDIDIRSFASVYTGYNQTEDALRADLKLKFENRFDFVGGQWIKVAERDGQIVGFIMACQTSKDPKSFTSWEDATDNGMINSTYDPDGKNLYVITLTMLKAGSIDLGQNMLFGHILSEMIREDLDLAFFSSRVPGLKSWVQLQCTHHGLEFDNLTKHDLDAYANEYYKLTKVKKGKRVPQDRLLEIYDSAGCKFSGIYSNAYQDEPSLNYSVLGIFENPFSKRLRQSRIVRYVAALALATASKSNYLMAKCF